MITRVLTLAVGFGLALGSGVQASDDRANPLRDGDTWEILRENIIGTQEIRDGEGLFLLEAPFRAHDAATVPVRFVQSPGSPAIRRLTLVVDENPAPLAAEFTFGPAMGEIDLETRLRVNSYSNVRAIAETEDGALYMVGRFVRASGGCAAPAARDMASAMALLGRMQVRWYDRASDEPESRRTTQVMMRHPNNSGLQRDQLTQIFVPAWFIDTVEVRLGDELLFSMTGGISLSEDPSFRFHYDDAAGVGLAVRATDTKGNEFGGEFKAGL